MTVCTVGRHMLANISLHSSASHCFQAITLIQTNKQTHDVCMGRSVGLCAQDLKFLEWEGQWAWFLLYGRS